jgi:hypothetical protein
MQLQNYDNRATSVYAFTDSIVMAANTYWKTQAAGRQD